MTNKITSITTAAALLLLVRGCHARQLPVETYAGPGVMECDVGQCQFDVADSLGCSDPCHTRTHKNMYELAFKHVSDVSGNVVSWGSVSGSRTCSHSQARNINAYFPDAYVAIEEGCTARCSGCRFRATTTISGPALMDCQNARCYAHTTDKFDCGDEIAEASGDYGSLHTLVGADDKTQSFHGYERINSVNNGPIRIPRGCTLECSGCTLGAKRFRLFRGTNDSHS